MPWNVSDSASLMPSSSSVGMSGRVDHRFLEVTAIARSLPSSIRPCSDPMFAVYQSTWAPTAAWLAGPAPANGICTMSVLILSLSSSPARYGVVPTPELVQFNLPGLALALAIRSGSDLMGELAGTVNTLGDAPSTMIGSKSLNGS